MVAFVFLLRHNLEFPALSANCLTHSRKQDTASFRFHFKSGSSSESIENNNSSNDGDGDDAIVDSTATDVDLRSNMARAITLWGGIIIPSGAHWCTLLFPHCCTLLCIICTLVHIFVKYFHIAVAHYWALFAQWCSF